MENEFLKSRSFLRQGAGLNAKSALILAEKDNYPIAWMCRQRGVARSSFYAWRSRAGTASATQARRDALRPEIHRVFTFLRGAGGCRRVATKLNDEGMICSVGLVADLMREMGLAAVQKRAYKRTTVVISLPLIIPQVRPWFRASRIYALGKDGCIWPLAWWSGGSAQPMKIPMACYGSIFPKALICPGGPSRNWKLWLWHSTIDHAKFWVSGPRQKSSQAS